MPVYQFFLGSNPEVSVAELRALKLLRPVSEYKELSSGGEKIVRFSQLEYTQGALQRKLNLTGGIPKVAILIQVGHLHPTDIVKTILRDLQQMYHSKQEEDNKRRLFLVTNVYGGNIDPKELKTQLRRALRGLKISPKFMGQYGTYYVPVATTYHLFRREGVEYNIMILSSNTVAVSKTIWVQDIRFWEYIDTKRPVRDMKIGILPSKLARIMLNLAGVHRNRGFWDPFVGVGTTVMQGQILGAYSYGSDISLKALQGADKNVQWLLHSGFVEGLRYRLFRFDARNDPKSNKMLRSIIRHGRFDAIVTEGYLGSRRTRMFPSREAAVREWQKIKPLYSALLKKQLPAVRVGGKFVFTVPVYRYSKPDGNSGLFVPPFEYNRNRLKPVSLASNNLLWISRKSNIGRKIFVLERIK